MTLAAANGERLVRVLSEHWIKYAGPVIVYLLLLGISLLLFLLAGVTAHHSMWLSHTAYLSALGLFLVNHHWFFFILLGESQSHIIITNKRVIHVQERLFLRDQMVEVAFDKMKTVEAQKQGLLENILRYGDLRFEKGAAVIPNVPHPNRAAKDIEQAMGLR